MVAVGLEPLAPPKISRHEGLAVVRDDLLPGGTKRRVVREIMAADRKHLEFVFGGPAQGYAQLALAYAAQDAGKVAHYFVAERKGLHPFTAEAKAAGAIIHEVPAGRLSVVQARAREWAAREGARFFPLGFDIPEFHAGLEQEARRLEIAAPGAVWACAGSGALSRALQRVWPRAGHRAVRIGFPPDVGRASLFEAPERFEQQAEIPPPFPSCPWYDAKVWRFARGEPGSLFWNVGA